MDASFWVTLASQFGVPVALVGYFVYRDHQRDIQTDAREKTLSGRLDVVQDRLFELQRTQIERNTATLERVEKAIDLCERRSS